MIENETLLGFALQALEPAEAEVVRGTLADDTAAQVSLARIHSILKPLEADRAAPVPPCDLVAATLARLDAPIVPQSRRMMASRWVELALAASVGLLAFGLIASALTKVNAHAQQVACQNNLRQISTGLHTYADNHHHKFPQVGVNGATAAGDFPKLLDQSGNWPSGLAPRCGGSAPVGYSYALGHRDAAGALIGPARDPDSAPLSPLVGDFPSRAAKLAGPVSPHGLGQNVLFADGTIRFLKKPLLGPDHIYLNDDGQPRAGLHVRDAVLGQPDDVP